MAMKSVVLLGVILVSVLLIFQDGAYARELTEAAKGGPGFENEKSQIGYINRGGYINGGYGYQFGRGTPPFGYYPGYLPLPFYGRGYGGLGYGYGSGQPFYGRGYGGLGYGYGSGQPFYGRPFVNAPGN